MGRIIRRVTLHGSDLLTPASIGHRPCPVDPAERPASRVGSHLTHDPAPVLGWRHGNPIS